MSPFPEGKFTIVNNETGRAVRVRLGRTTDVSDYQKGTKYLQNHTTPPLLELGEADNTPVTAWWHSTLQDPVARRPFNQIVSHAVGEYQNIGNYCVWMHKNASKEALERFSTEEAFQNRLDGMPADVRGRLAPLIPAEWTTIQADARAEKAQSRAFREEEEAYAAADAEFEAWEAEDNPPSAEDLGRLRAYRREIIEGTIPTPEETEEFSRQPEGTRDRWLRTYILSPEKQEALRMGIEEQMKNAVERLKNDPRAEQVAKRAEKLLPEIKERRAAAALAAIPQDDLHEWHSKCSFRKVIGSRGDTEFTGVRRGSSQYDRLIAALDTYLEAAAREGIVPPVIGSDCATSVYGCGASTGTRNAYGWTYDGTYIYAADSHTISAERTYWTDADGYLVGRPKGGPGQTWSITQWKP
ncbi:hypothetical protein CP980_34990 [Streptomyces vinaceus]|uniref:Uncharacterized protein n=1 Tax=Streptomyces vinaceus TaxID=1960 RepID=A0A5J6JIJ5_STRVI|nr:hypothetical protein [Streptomyces vinaceus]QEV49532.1 hypothetical protein CP980_34990 [Streptomyces vinaceus]GHE46497.1 hypothetical protein GCM10017778_33030 [Streptomyces vinaceus]